MVRIGPACPGSRQFGPDSAGRVLSGIRSTANDWALLDTAVWHGMAVVALPF